MVLEYVKVQLNDGVDKGEYIELAKQVEKEFISQQQGFIRHTSWWTEDGSWVDLIEWETMEQAKAATDKAMQSDTCNRWFSMMKLEALVMEHLDQAVEY